MLPEHCPYDPNAKLSRAARIALQLMREGYTLVLSGNCELYHQQTKDRRSTSRSVYRQLYNAGLIWETLSKIGEYYHFEAIPEQFLIVPRTNECP